MALDKKDEEASTDHDAAVSQDGAEKDASGGGGEGARLSTREMIIAAIAETKKRAESAADAASETPSTTTADAETPQKEPKGGGSSSSRVDEETTQEGRPPEEQRSPDGKTADKPEDGSGEENKPEDDASKGDDGAQTEKKKSESSSEPPAAWSKSSKAQWESLSPSIQAEVLRREANAQKGVEELKNRHRAELEETRGHFADLDASIAPYREAIRQAGRSEGQVIDRLFQWHMALSGPNKQDAFRALARNFGVDVSTLAGGAPQPRGQQQQSSAADDADAAQTQNRDGTTFSPAPQDLSWMPALEGLTRRFDQYEAATVAQQQATAQRTVADWSKDKPHFDRVRKRMAQMIDMDVLLLQQGQPAVNGFIKGDHVDMDAAYEAAIWADPELRFEFMQDQRRKEEEAVQAVKEQQRVEAEKKLRAKKAELEALQAKRAASSLKPGAPLSGVVNGAGTIRSSASHRHESVRDSIRRALSER